MCYMLSQRKCSTIYFLKWKENGKRYVKEILIVLRSGNIAI